MVRRSWTASHTIIKVAVLQIIPRTAAPVITIAVLYMVVYVIFLKKAKYCIPKRKFARTNEQ